MSRSPRPLPKLPPAGKGQIQPDPRDPRYDDASTFGKPFGEPIK